MELQRRKFILKAGALSTFLALNPLAMVSPGLADPAKPSRRQITWRNWGGNLSCQPGQVIAPRAEEEVVDLLATTQGQIRPVGTGHSWSGLVPTEGNLVTLDRLKGLIDHDPETLQAEIFSGTKLFALGPMLDEVGQSIVNMSDIDYQTLAGATATSTHGTGANLGSMSSLLIGLRLVTPQGEVLDLSETQRPDLFAAAKNSLGALGIITRLRFQNREKHRLHQKTWLADMDEMLPEISSYRDKHLHFELFPLPNSNRTLVVTTDEAADGEADVTPEHGGSLTQLRDLFSFTRKIPGLDEFAYNTALDYTFSDMEHRVGPSYKVLAHPRTDRFIEMEYTVPAEVGPECLKEVLAVIRAKAPEVCFPLEFRYIRQDSTMIGMYSERDGCAISIHQFADNPNWLAYFKLLEPVFQKYAGRPHWGKWHSLGDKDLAVVYPQWQQFKALRQELDPRGRMLNSHLQSLFATT